MIKNFELFEIREYFGEVLKNSWVFGNREEAERFYNLRHNKNSSRFVKHQLIKIHNDVETILKTN